MRSTAAIALAALSLAVVATADDTYYGPPANTLTPPPPGHSVASYAAVGSSLIQNNFLDRMGWTEAQADAFVEGVRAALHGKTMPLDDDSRRLAGEIAGQLEKLKARPPEIEAPVSVSDNIEAYMREMQRHFLLQRTHSGLGYDVLPGPFGGQRPRPQDTVVVSLTCISADGVKLPQFSMENVHIKVSDMLPGLAEGLQMMTVDGHGRFVVPPMLSFGHGAWPDGVTPGAPLLFTVVLHQIICPERSP